MLVDNFINTKLFSKKSPLFIPTSRKPKHRLRALFAKFKIIGPLTSRNITPNYNKRFCNVCTNTIRKDARLNFIASFTCVAIKKAHFRKIISCLWKVEVHEERISCEFVKYNPSFNNCTLSVLLLRLVEGKIKTCLMYLS